MIEVTVTPEMLKRARDRSEKMGSLKNSITNGDGNVAGFIGEEIANTIINGEIADTRNYDIVKNGVKIDVKTKRCRDKPEDYYECSIAAFNVVQKCDHYVFVRVKNDLKVGWILGYFPKNDYFQNSRFLQKGDRDGDNGFKVKADCYNIAISDLKEVSEKSF